MNSLNSFCPQKSPVIGWTTSRPIAWITDFGFGCATLFNLPIMFYNCSF